MTIQTTQHEAEADVEAKVPGDVANVMKQSVRILRKLAKKRDNATPID